MGCSSQYKDAVQLFLEQIDVIKRLVTAYPDDLQFVTDAAGKSLKNFGRDCLKHNPTLILLQLIFI